MTEKIGRDLFVEELAHQLHVQKEAAANFLQAFEQRLRALGEGEAIALADLGEVQRRKFPAVSGADPVSGQLVTSGERWLLACNSRLIEPSTPPVVNQEQELVRLLAKDLAWTADLVAAYLDAFLNTVIAALRKKQSLELSGFGTFTNAYEPKPKRNPKTFEVIAPERPDAISISLIEDTPTPLYNLTDY